MRYRLLLHTGTALYLAGAAITFGAFAIDVLARGGDWLALLYATSASGATVLAAMHIGVAVDLAEDADGS